MSKQIKILFTSVGRRVELVQAFRNESIRLKIDIKIYGADNSNTAPALFFCDEKLSICRIDNENYILELLRICTDEKIDILIPTIDTDLLILAENKDIFEQNGTKVLISSADRIRICRDKRETAAFFRECGLLAPITVDAIEDYREGFPCFIKPLNGSSSKDAFRISDMDDLCVYTEQIEDYIIQPFIEGKEYTVDIFCDFNGKLICVTPRERIAVRSGEVIKTQILNDEKIIEECKCLVEHFKPCGPLTVQLIRQKNTGNDYYIEINPRFGGGAPISMQAGANSAEALIQILHGKIAEDVMMIAKNNLVFCRFDQSICVNNSIEDKYLRQYKAIIFDLDDTLYSEKDYIRSGFNRVGNILQDIDNVEVKLWNAFINGENAIDKVLKDESIYSECLKEKCLSTYRHHKPKIKMYDGMKEILMMLHHSGIRLGLITDGRPEGQNAKIEALGLRDLMDEIIITDELGGVQFRKPNDIAFRLMHTRLGVPVELTAYIGDNPTKDFVAPLNLGMGCIYFKNSNGLYSKDNKYSINETYETFDLLINRLKNI
jgi:FMN phosphatase YigB (HAD superfamily)/predicted ATP-grasp superfamily ATP-dependent carboligase